MQIPITLENKLIYIKKTSDPFGMNVPFETSSYREDFEQSMSGGFFDLSDWGIVEIKGPDARDFLQRMTTVDFKKISSHKVVPGAFLTGRGGVVALGMFRMLKDEHFLFITGPGQESASLDHIDRFHFQEKLEAQTAGQDSVVLGLWATPEQLEKKLGWKLGAALEVTQSTLDSVGVETWIDNRRPFLVWCQLQRNNALAFITALSKKGFDLLGTHVFHFYRIQAGMPWMGWEITDKDLILEANLEDHVARNKGCYPGQEVVERIFTYGQVNRKLFVVELKTQ
ncbi:MAG: hypothetical protein EBZ49_15390, partial [Proteobacteria bacterium]|nr:hypothetical protein [Pseudomonadota bacterium]